MAIKIGDDLMTLIKEELDDIAENHLDVWKDRYYLKSKDQIAEDLYVNHDFSGEVENAEHDLNRKLTDDEEIYFEKQFIDAVKRHIAYVQGAD